MLWIMCKRLGPVRVKLSNYYYWIYTEVTSTYSAAASAYVFCTPYNYAPVDSVT